MQSKGYMPDSGKKMTIAVLAAMAVLIMASGVFFCVYSFINHISFRVINTDVSGIIFGLTVFYLGLRYALSVLKLRKEVYKPTSIFRWRNFKRQKAN